MNRVIEVQNYAKSIEPNVKLTDGINWLFADGFRSKEKAELFVKKCEELGLRCDDPCPDRDNDNLFNVRYR